MMYNGRREYVKSTKAIIEGREAVAKKINAIEELEVIGEPKLGNMAFRSLDKSVNIFYLANYMATRGWKLVPTPKYHTIRVLVHPNNLPHLEQLCAFIKEGVKQVKENPDKYKEGPASRVGDIESLDDRSKRTEFETRFHELYNIENYMGVNDKS